MSSVAVPASTAVPSPLGAEGDLVRLAARGDAESFAELFRRHAQPAWRLAQAVAADRDSAIDAFRSGFVRALGRRLARRDEGSTFRTAVLGAIYKAAVDKAANRVPATPSRRTSANADVALADAAFRSLPDRWRAAVWLAEVENFDPDCIAPVLGVSNAVASQLVARGRRALAGRFAQAHREVPDLFGPVLRPIALGMPTSLAENTRAYWSSAGSEREPVVAPIAQWLEQKAVRPMTVAVGALIGLGLIGLGVVPQGSAMRAQLGSNANGRLGGAVPAQTCFGLACPGGANGAGTSAALAASNGFSTTGTGGGTLTGTSVTAVGPSSGAASTSGSGPSTPAGGPSTPGGGPTTPGGGGGPTTPPAPKPTPGTPLANLTITSSSASVTLLPSSGGSGTATATLSTSGSPLCVTSGQVSLGCSTGTTATSNQSAPASSSSSLLSGTTNTITNTVQGVSSTIANTGL